MDCIEQYQTFLKSKLDANNDFQKVFINSVLTAQKEKFVSNNDLSNQVASHIEKMGELYKRKTELFNSISGPTNSENNIQSNPEHCSNDDNVDKEDNLKMDLEGVSHEVSDKLKELEKLDLPQENKKYIYKLYKHLNFKGNLRRQMISVKNLMDEFNVYFVHNYDITAIYKTLNSSINRTTESTINKKQYMTLLNTLIHLLYLNPITVKNEHSELMTIEKDINKMKKEISSFYGLINRNNDEIIKNNLFLAKYLKKDNGKKVMGYRNYKSLDTKIPEGDGFEFYKEMQQLYTINDEILTVNEYMLCEKINVSNTSE